MCYEEHKRIKTNRMKKNIESDSNNKVIIRKKGRTNTVNSISHQLADTSSKNNYKIEKKSTNNKTYTKSTNVTNIVNDYKNEALNLHNNYRKKHKSEQLVLNDELNNMAQKYAEKCAETNTIDFCSDLFNDNIIGQNIAVINEDLLDVSKICNSWYEEKKNYDYKSKRCKKNTGHFTQLIWKETKLIGFGSKKSKNGNIYFVAYYYPAGNIFNKFKENVQKENIDF